MSQLIPLSIQYMLYVVAVSLGVFALGASVFLPETSLLGLAREFLRTDWKYLGVAWAVTFGVNQLADFHAGIAFTGTILAVEGSAVGVFQSVTSLPLTVLFTAVYLVGLPFVVLFTYFKLKADAEEEAYRYALSYVTLVLLATPFFLLFPVRVTGYTLPTVHPLLYDLNPLVTAGTISTDTLMKSFPSLHTGLSVLAALYARKTERSYALTVGFLALAIVVSTFYLGVHWLTDAAFSVVLVSIAYYLAQRHPDPRRPLSVARRFRS